MEFIGPQDYYFWEGVEYAVNSSTTSPDDYIDNRFTFINKTTISCIEAFKWGFYLGKELSYDEYIDLTTYIKPVIIEEVAVKPTINTAMTGNC